MPIVQSPWCGTLVGLPDLERLQAAEGDDDCADEDDSLCPLLDAGLARRLVLPGGHHFGGDYPVIATRILAEAGIVAQSPDGNAAP